VSLDPPWRDGVYNALGPADRVAPGTGEGQRSEQHETGQHGGFYLGRTDMIPSHPPN